MENPAVLCRGATVYQLLIMAAQLQFPAKLHSGTFVALDKSGDLDKLLVSAGFFWDASRLFFLLPSLFSVSMNGNN